MVVVMMGKRRLAQVLGRSVTPFLVCPFDKSVCMRNGRCGKLCRHCRVMHFACSRFSVEKFNGDVSIRRGFGFGADRMQLIGAEFTS